MPKGSTFANDLLKLVFNATPIANIADNAASSPLGNLYVSLHTADPGRGGSQTTSEANYTGYARVALVRTSSGWTVTGNSVSPVAAISFGACTAGTNSITHFAIGTASSGTGKILYVGTVGGAALGPFSALANGNITLPALSGLAVDDRIVFDTVPSAVLPTGLTAGTVYWVKTVSTDVITIATTQGGTALTFSNAGDGVAAKIVPIAVSAGVTPQITTASTIVDD
jgi:hypothetical protein